MSQKTYDEVLQYNILTFRFYNRSIHSISLKNDGVDLSRFFRSCKIDHPCSALVRRRQQHVLRRCRSLNNFGSSRRRTKSFPVGCDERTRSTVQVRYTCLLHTTAHHPPYPPIHSTLPHITRHPLSSQVLPPTARPFANLTKQDTCLVRTHHIV